MTDWMVLMAAMPSTPVSRQARAGKVTSVIYTDIPLRSQGQDARMLSSIILALFT